MSTGIFCVSTFRPRVEGRNVYRRILCVYIQARVEGRNVYRRILCVYIQARVEGRNVYRRILFLLGATATSTPSGPGPSHSRRFLDHTQTHHTRYDSSGRVISPTQRPLHDNTKHSQQTDIQSPPPWWDSNPQSL